MTRLYAALAATVLTALPMTASAQSGDAAAGERAFRACQACHVVVNDAGDTLAGRNARTGPNLYGIAGRAAGSVDGFRYSASLSAAGEAGLVWDEASFAAYVQDPTGFLSDYLGDSGARGNMAYKVRKEQDAADLYAYLASLE